MTQNEVLALFKDAQRFVDHVGIANVTGIDYIAADLTAKEVVAKTSERGTEWCGSPQEGQRIATYDEVMALCARLTDLNATRRMVPIMVVNFKDEDGEEMCHPLYRIEDTDAIMQAGEEVKEKARTQLKELLKDLQPLLKPVFDYNLSADEDAPNQQVEATREQLEPLVESGKVFHCVACMMAGRGLQVFHATHDPDDKEGYKAAVTEVLDALGVKDVALAEAPTGTVQ